MSGGVGGGQHPGTWTKGLTTTLYHSQWTVEVCHLSPTSPAEHREYFN